MGFPYSGDVTHGIAWKAHSVDTEQQGWGVLMVM